MTMKPLKLTIAEVRVLLEALRSKTKTKANVVDFATGKDFEPETAIKLDEKLGNYAEQIEDAIDAEMLAALPPVGSDEADYLPQEMVERMLAGENLIRVWREHRGLKGKELAEQAGINAGYLSQIESGQKTGSVEALKRVADVLGVDIDDLV